jgi:hypothetical protein
VTAFTVYVALSKIFPSETAKEFGTTRFEELAPANMSVVEASEDSDRSIEEIQVEGKA